MIELTFSRVKGTGRMINIEAWLCGARVANAVRELPDYAPSDYFDTPEVRATMTDIAQPTVDRLREHFAAEQAEALRKDAAWTPVTEGLPEIATNTSCEFIVACKRKHNGETYVFAAEYLQELLLQSAHDDDEHEDGRPYTGWFALRNCEYGDFDTEWANIEVDGSVITHWMPLSKPPAAIAKGTQDQ